MALEDLEDPEDPADPDDLADLEDPVDLGVLGDCRGGMIHLTLINFKCLENFLEIVHPMPPSGCMGWHDGANVLGYPNMITFRS